MTYYGEYAVTLRSLMIEDRASVFEQNPFVFNRRHHVIAGTAPPPGFRSIWDKRGQLAVAKLQPDIVKGSTLADFVNVLMEPRRAASDCDFVEVHIFGPVNRRCIESIVGPVPTSRPDRAVWRQLRRKAEELDAIVETRP